MGLFHTVVPKQVKDLSLFPTLNVAHPVETDRPDQAKSVLWAHIVATASNSKVVQDSDMAIPANWKKGHGSKDTGKGHVEGGRTVCLHSLAVCPKLQGCGLGKVILKSFLWQMKAMGVERVALICQDVSSGGPTPLFSGPTYQSSLILLTTLRLGNTGFCDSTDT